MEKTRRESLEKAEAKIKMNEPKPTGVWGLMKSIHSSPGLREWVTLETVALNPFVIRTKGDGGRDSALIFSLLSASRKQNEKTLIFPPWGLLGWQWPSGRVIMRKNVGELIANSEFSCEMEWIVSEERAVEIQKGIEYGGKVPEPPEKLRKLYSEVFGKIPELKNFFLKTDFDEQARAARREINSENLSKGIYSRLMESKEFINDLNQPGFLKEWKRIFDILGKPNFSVAVVGEFSRGKSSLINTLIGQDLLPVGDLPTTAVITRVIYGREPSMTYISPGGEKIKLSMGEESWEDIISRGFDKQGIVEIEIPVKWLKDAGVQLIDTPGAGELSQDRMERVTEAISSCDGVLIAVSATMALSLTERDFIEQHIFSKKIPRAAVVVTRLDQIPGEDRRKVMDYVKGKLSEWSSKVLLYSSHGAPVLENISGLDGAGTDAILKLLHSWAMNEEHQSLRINQVNYQLQSVLEGIRKTLSTQREAARMSREEKEKLLREAIDKTEKTRTRWEDLRLEVDRRENEVYKWLEGAIFERKREIVERLNYELNKVSNPKEWWEKDLPYRLRQELSRVGNSLENTLQKRIASDALWINEQVKKVFSWSIKMENAEQLIGSDEPDFSINGERLTDINKLKLFSRLGFGAVTVLGYLLVGPLGMAVNLGGGIISEKLLRDSMEKQRRSLARNLDGLVYNTMAKASETIDQRLQNVYRSMLKELSKQEALWAASCRKAMKTGQDGEGSELEKIDERIKRVDEIIKGLGD